MIAPAQDPDKSPLPPELPFTADINGYPVSYVERGAGRTVVFVHV